MVDLSHKCPALPTPIFWEKKLTSPPTYSSHLFFLSDLIIVTTGKGFVFTTSLKNIGLDQQPLASLRCNRENIWSLSTLPHLLPSSFPISWSSPSSHHSSASETPPTIWGNKRKGNLRVLPNHQLPNPSFVVDLAWDLGEKKTAWVKKKLLLRAVFPYKSSPCFLYFFSQINIRFGLTSNWQKLSSLLAFGKNKK